MHTKDDKAYATLTDVKNKTGDVFALADEFGEVVITSYNKAKYAIKRLSISKKEVPIEHAVSELETPVPIEIEGEQPQAVQIETPEQETVPSEPVATEMENDQIQPIVPVTDPEPQPSELDQPALEQPLTQDPIVDPNPTDIPTATTDVVTPIAEITETIVEMEVPVTPVPIPVPIPTPLPALPPTDLIAPTDVPPTPEPVSPPEVPPPIEIVSTSAQAEKPASQRSEIVGIFAGIGFDSLWDRSSRQEQTWAKDAHKLL